MKRDHQIDNIKGLLIILVIFGHSLELLRLNSTITSYIYNFIYTFHMPIFIFISGYLSKNIQKGRDNAFRQLFIPFLIFNSLWNFIQIIMTRLLSLPIESAETFSFLNPGWALWYILALFIWKLLLPDIIKIKNVFLLVLGIGVLSRLFTEFNVFLSLSRLFVFTPYFVAGYLFSTKQLTILRESRRRNSLVLLIIALAFNYYFLFHTNYPTEFLWADRPFSFFSENFLVSIFFGILLYIIGFSFIIVFLRLTPGKENKITQIGKNSFPVYILHTYLIGAIAYALLPINHYVQISLLFIISVILALLLSSKTINHMFTSFLKSIDSIFFKTPTR